MEKYETKINKLQRDIQKANKEKKEKQTELERLLRKPELTKSSREFSGTRPTLELTQSEITGTRPALELSQSEITGTRPALELSSMEREAKQDNRKKNKLRSDILKLPR
jgi:predicted  nucleic acid-binding Zn-ribbon protein